MNSHTVLISPEELRRNYGSHVYIQFDDDTFEKNKVMLGMGILESAYEIPFVGNGLMTAIISNFPSSPAVYISEGCQGHDGRKSGNPTSGKLNIEHEPNLKKEETEKEVEQKFKTAVKAVEKKWLLPFVFGVIDFFGGLNEVKHNKLKARKSFLNTIRVVKDKKPDIQVKSLSKVYIPAMTPAIGDIFYMADTSEDRNPELHMLKVSAVNAYDNEQTEDGSTLLSIVVGLDNMDKGAVYHWNGVSFNMKQWNYDGVDKIRLNPYSCTIYKDKAEASKAVLKAIEDKKAILDATADEISKELNSF